MLLFTNSQLQAIILLWVAVLYNAPLAAADDTCSIIGLPEHTQRRGNVYFARYDVPSVDLALQCRCTVNTPTWVQYRLHNDTFTNALPRSVHCVNNGEDCSPKSYILPSDAAPGYYVYQNYTFHIHEPTVLLCSSTNDKLTVVVNVLVFQQHSTTSSGNHITTTSTEHVQQSCLPTSTIINTIQNTAGGGKSIPAASISTTTPSSIISTTSTVRVQRTVTHELKPLTQTVTTQLQLQSVTTLPTTTSTTSVVEQASQPMAVSKSSYDGTYATPVIVIGEITDKGSSQSFGTTPTLVFLGLTCLLVVLNAILVIYIVYIKKTHIKIVKEFNYMANDVSRRSSMVRSECTECSSNTSSDNQQISATHSNSEV